VNDLIFSIHLSDICVRDIGRSCLVLSPIIGQIQ
jgi:hypothetical protein